LRTGGVWACTGILFPSVSGVVTELERGHLVVANIKGKHTTNVGGRGEREFHKVSKPKTRYLTTNPSAGWTKDPEGPNSVTEFASGGRGRSVRQGGSRELQAKLQFSTSSETLGSLLGPVRADGKNKVPCCPCPSSCRKLR